MKNTTLTPEALLDFAREMRMAAESETCAPAVAFKLLRELTRLQNLAMSTLERCALSELIDLCLDAAEAESDKVRRLALLSASEKAEGSAGILDPYNYDDG